MFCHHDSNGPLDLVIEHILGGQQPKKMVEVPIKTEVISEFQDVYLPFYAVDAPSLLAFLDPQREWLHQVVATMITLSCLPLVATDMTAP